MIQKLKQFLDSNDSAIKDTDNTFLSVIGKSYDEDLISRVVAYCLSIDPSLIKMPSFFKIFLYYLFDDSRKYLPALHYF